MKPQRLGNVSIPDEELIKDRKECKKIGPDVVIGKGVHAENLVIDKHARLIRGKRIIASPDKPGYIKRGDRL